MKTRITIVTLCAVILAACAPPAPSADEINTAIAQTEAAKPTETRLPTDTPRPTNTPKPTSTKRPTATKTPAPSVEEVRQKLLDAVVSDLSGFEDIEAVSLVRFNEGALEIEVKTKWASQDRQPDVSWTIIGAFADAFSGFDKENLELVAGGPFTFSLTTFSSRGDYRYQSVTDLETMLKIANRSISYDEWVTAAEAAFK
jgi:hypothetical protein